ncbi:MAG: 50S ribosomal protein L25 [Spirochaetes bacterium]|nr:50S ribosomal protein L25 [Spirochaetota bacterium]
MERRHLNVEIRTERGKNENVRLRQSGYIPAILYSHGESESIKVAQKDFFTLFKGRVSESVIFDIIYKDKSGTEGLQAFVKDYQKNPITDEIIHLDLFKVTKGERIHTHIPVEIVGHSAGVKRGGTMEIYNREIEIECLPKDLPEKVSVDVTEMLEGDTVHAKDIVLGDDVKLLSSPDLVIVAVHATRVTTEAEPSEGEEAAEGAEGAATEAEE